MPSCPRSSAMSRFMKKSRDDVAASSLSGELGYLLLHHPLAIHNLNHHCGALIEAQVIVWAHVEDAVRTRCVFYSLERITQRATKFLRAGLTFFERDWNGLLQKHAGIPRVRAKSRHAALSLRTFIRRHIGHCTFLHRMIVGQLFGDQHWPSRQKRALAILAAHPKKIIVGDTMCLINLARIAALLERFLRQRGRCSRASYQNRIGFRTDELQY